MKLKKLQLIINIITIINIIIIVIFIYNLFINNIYSRRYIKELFEKNYNYKNYIIEIEKISIDTNEMDITRITQKEDACKIEYINRNSTRWYANDIVIIDDKQNNIKQYSNQSTQESLTLLANQFEIYMYIDTAEEYEYIKKESYNGVECIVIELKNVYTIKEEGESKSYNYRFWMDIEKGFILKQEKYCEGILQEIVKYTVKECCVTDEDVKIPKLEEYEKIDK